MKRTVLVVLVGMALLVLAPSAQQPESKPPESIGGDQASLLKEIASLRTQLQQEAQAVAARELGYRVESIWRGDVPPVES